MYTQAPLGPSVRVPWAGAVTSSNTRLARAVSTSVASSSRLTLPFSLTLADWSTTTGAVFTGVTLMVTWAEDTPVLPSSTLKMKLSLPL